MRRIALLVLVLVAALAHSPAAAEDPWAAPGPHQVVREALDADHTAFRPADLNAGKYPVVLWGNGAAATVDDYTDLLRHWASHGFIVAAHNGRSGTGKEMLAGLDRLATLNTSPGSPYQGHVDLGRVGASGHSLGGGAAVGAGADPRVATVAPMLGGPFNKPAELRGPALFTAAQLDLIVWPSVVHGQYEQADQVPAYYAELKGAGHFEVSGDGGGLRGPVTAWFHYRLKGDAAAGKLFDGPNCGLCTDPAWSKFERNALARPV